MDGGETKEWLRQRTSKDGVQQTYRPQKQRERNMRAMVGGVYAQVAMQNAAIIQNATAQRVPNDTSMVQTRTGQWCRKMVVGAEVASHRETLLHNTCNQRAGALIMNDRQEDTGSKREKEN